MLQESEITLRICKSVEQLEGCVALQRSVFDMPEIEISPVRHFVVTMHAGGFTIGAFDGKTLVGFCLSVPAILEGKKAFYSHMTAVATEYQCRGIGLRLKRLQREECLKRGVEVVKWTFQPEKSLNAFFNLEKLGAEVREYIPNFYGTDYPASAGDADKIGIRSDRLFAVWKLNSRKSRFLASGKPFVEISQAETVIPGIADWNGLLNDDAAKAAHEQDRLCTSFREAFARGLVCRGYRKGDPPEYLFYKA